MRALQEHAFCCQFVNTLVPESANAMQRTYLVHTCAMRSAEKRPSRRQGEARAGKKRREFEELFNRLRAARDPDEARRLGDRLGGMIFSGRR